MNTYGIYAVGVGASGSIGLIQSQNLNPGISHILNSGSGDIDAKFGAILSQAPTASFTTRAVSTALGLIGIDGLALNAEGPLTLYMEKRAQGGLKTAGSVHTKAVIDGGIVVPQTLSCSQDALATISYLVQAADAAGDATNPLTITESQALAGTAHLDEAYTISPVLIGEGEIDGIQSINVDFGIDLVVSKGGGSVFPQEVAMIKRQPVLTFTTLDAAITATIAEGGMSLAAGATFQLQAVTKSSVPSGAGITIEVGAGIAYATALGGDHQGNQTFAVTIIPTVSGTDAILVVGTF